MEQNGEATRVADRRSGAPERVVYRMAEKGCTRVPVVERDTRKFLGLVSLNDLLKARSRHLEEETRRERSLKLNWFRPEAQRSDGSEPFTVL